MKHNLIRVAILSLGVMFSVGTISGCTPDTGVKTTKVKKASDVPSKRTSIVRSPLDVTVDGWKPVQAVDQAIQQRNPFRGFTDTLLAEALLRQQSKDEQNSDTQLPEQLYGTRDYRVVGVITGTADPKVYVLDPSGNRFILRRGSQIGNNNGVISSIHRDGIEVYERVADKGQYVELPLYEENKDKTKISLSLQQ